MHSPPALCERNQPNYESSYHRWTNLNNWNDDTESNIGLFVISFTILYHASRVVRERYVLLNSKDSTLIEKESLLNDCYLRGLEQIEEIEMELRSQEMLQSKRESIYHVCGNDNITERKAKYNHFTFFVKRRKGTLPTWSGNESLLVRLPGGHFPVYNYWDVLTNRGLMSRIQLFRAILWM